MLSRQQIRVQAWADLLKVVKVLLAKEPGGPSRRNVAIVVESMGVDEQRNSQPPDWHGIRHGTTVVSSIQEQLAARIAVDLSEIGLAVRIHRGTNAPAPPVTPPARSSSSSVTSLASLAQTAIAEIDAPMLMLDSAEVVIVIGSRRMRYIYDTSEDGGLLKEAIDSTVARSSEGDKGLRRVMVLPVLGDPSAEPRESLPHCLLGFICHDFRDELHYERAMTRIGSPPGIIPAITGMHPDGSATCFGTLAPHLTKYVLRLCDKRIPTRNSDFVARGNMLDQIRRLLDSGVTTLISSNSCSLPGQRQSDLQWSCDMPSFVVDSESLICHATGVGKTAVAIEYAWMGLEKKSYKFVRWFDVAGSCMDLQFREFAFDLHIADVSMPIEQVIAAVFERLSQLSISYLLVFDGAPCLTSIAQYLPPHTGAQKGGRAPVLRHALVTSPYCDKQHCWPQGTQVEVPPLNDEETDDLLRAEFPFIEEGDVDALRSATGAIPLGLNQVVAYLWKNELSDQVPVCIDELTNARRDLKMNATAAMNVAAWRLCVSTLRNHDPVAHAVYRLLAYIPRPAVPFWMLVELSNHGAFDNVNLNSEKEGSFENEELAVVDRNRLERAVQSLREMRLCRCSAVPIDQDYIRVNQFGQAAIRWSDSCDGKDPWIQSRIIVQTLTSVLTERSLLKRSYAAGTLAEITNALASTCLEAFSKGTFTVVRPCDAILLCKALVALGQHNTALLVLEQMTPDMLRLDQQDTMAGLVWAQATCLLGKLHYTAGDLSTAATLIEEGLRWYIARARTSEEFSLKNAEDIADAYAYLGRAYRALDKAAPQLCALNVAVQWLEMAHGPNHYLLVPVLQELSYAHDLTADPIGRLRVLKQCLSVQRAAHYCDTADIRQTLKEIGLVSAELSDFPAAVRALDEALCSWQQQEEQFHNHREIARLMRHLGDAHCANGSPVKGLELIQLALSKLADNFGASDIDVALTTVSLANAYGELGRRNRQFALLNDALERLRSALGDDHSEIARTLTNLGNVQARLGRLHAARASYEEALRIKRGVYGERHPELAKAFANYGNLMLRTGGYAVALAALQHSLAIKEEFFGNDHFEIASVLTSLAKACGAQGDAEKQVEFCERALEIQRHYYGNTHMNVARAMAALAEGYGRLGRPLEQRDLLRQVHTICRQHLSTLPSDEASQAEPHLLEADVLVKIARTFGNDATDIDAKIDLLSRALHVQENAVFVAVQSAKPAGPASAAAVGSATDQLCLVPTLAELSWAHASKKDFVAAIEYMGMALAIQRSNPERPELVEKIESNLRVLQHKLERSVQTERSRGGSAEGGDEPDEPVSPGSAANYNADPVRAVSSLMARRNIPQSMQPKILSLAASATQEGIDASTLTSISGHSQRLSAPAPQNVAAQVSTAWRHNSAPVIPSPPGGATVRNGDGYEDMKNSVPHKSAGAAGTPTTSTTHIESIV